LYLEVPFFGSRRMAVMLGVNRKRVQRLMRIAGIEAIYPKPQLSRPAPGHEIYPYLLRGVSIERPNHAFDKRSWQRYRPSVAIGSDPYG
jgi:putative transposase